MASHEVLGQVFESNDIPPGNKNLLKKIILTSYLGRLRINNLAPDKKYSLADYLIDEENIFFDFTRLSHEKSKQFKSWLLKDHQKEKGPAFLGRVAINEYRGYSAEVSLSWWGKFKSWLMNKRHDHWCLSDLTLSMNHQLTGLNLCYGKKGLLISFNQFLPPNTKDKYRDPDSRKQDSTGNTKRVYLTDQLVDRLIKTSISGCHFEAISSEPHPQALTVSDYPARFRKMHEYRKCEQFLAIKPWYKRLYKWIESLFRPERVKKSEEKKSNDLVNLMETEQVAVYRRVDNHEILVVERRPEIEKIVFCGGGARLIAHDGIYKALCEAGLRPKKYAGSSAGAIMALLGYLDYSADEIFDFFKSLRKDNIVYYDIDRRGMSDTNSLKAALDYMLSRKILRLSETYGFAYPKGKMTFATLENIRKKYPDCGLGELLTVTATKLRQSKTKYFSFKDTPDEEVTDAVTASACMPVVYRSVYINGEEFTDGGLKSNFPTEVFKGSHNSTLLESEHGNDLEMIGIQFDNGTERNALDRVKDRVYRENKLLNWLYQLITGVNDPASGWEQDRIKLRELGSQSIVIEVDKNISASNFDLTDETKGMLLQQGYKAGKEYIALRYNQTDAGLYENQELMYSNFETLADLLSYCCYRGNLEWFNKVYRLIDDSSMANRKALIADGDKLKKLYFSDAPLIIDTDAKGVPSGLFNHHFDLMALKPAAKPAILAFVNIYPVLHKLTHHWFSNKIDQNAFLKARHSLSLKSPFECLNHLQHLTGEVNIVFHIVHRIINQMKENPHQNLLYALLQKTHDVLHHVEFLQPYYFANWNLSFRQCHRLLSLFEKKQWAQAKLLCDHLKQGDEPMTVFNDEGEDAPELNDTSAAMSFN